MSHEALFGLLAVQPCVLRRGWRGPAPQVPVDRKLVEVVVNMAGSSVQLRLHGCKPQLPSVLTMGSGLVVFERVSRAHSVDTNLRFVTVNDRVPATINTTVIHTPVLSAYMVMTHCDNPDQFLLTPCTA